MQPLLTLTLTLALGFNAQASLFGPKDGRNAEKKANIRQQRDEMLA